MLRHLLRALPTLALLSLAAPAAGAPPQDEPDPDRRVLTIKKGGEKIGELSYKWVRTSSGNEFASSKAELKTGGDRFIIRSHLKRRPDGVVEKYKKWIGLEGAKPDVIVFWKGTNIRTVSKVPDQKFTRTFKPPESFFILDDLAFHLYRDFVVSWRRNGDGAADVLGIRDGKFAQVAVTGIGAAQITRKEKAQTMDVVEVEIDGQRTLVYADDKNEIWGIIAPGLTLTRGGWALGEVQAPVAAPSDPNGLPGTPDPDPTVGGPLGPKVGAEAPPADVGSEAPPAEEPERKPLPID